MTITTVLSVAPMEVPTRPSNGHGSKWSNRWRQPNMKRLWNTMKRLGGNFQAIASTQATQGSCCHPREYPTEPLRRLHAPHEHPLQPGNHPAEQAPQWTTSSGTRHVPSPTSRATKPGPFPIRITCVESVFQLKVRPDSGFPGALRIGNRSSEECLGLYVVSEGHWSECGIYNWYNW